ncbi:MAG: hypothetical protein P4M12_00040 [Gammaproteobacteria bacterium]|nr:hypothetical protein [Gammaproteobacteria bacterium]
MLINLITAWKDSALPEILNENKLSEAKEIQNLVVAQSSFQFDTPPRVVFVKDMHTQEEATHYGDLPVVSLQAEEQKIYDQTLSQLSANKNFYNGNQIVLTGAVYDTSSNTLYLEALRVDYVFLVTLEKMKATKSKGSALHHKDFFKTGVLAPFISNDDKVSIIARKDKWTLRSVAAGFLECDDAAQPLKDLITETASKEADEEFALDRAGKRRFDFVGSATVASISFRDVIGMGMTPTIEFVAPIRIKQDANFILSIMNNNEAIDAHEHVAGSAISVSVAADEREMATHFMRQKLPGNFLYGPVLHACAVQVNQGMQFARRISEIHDSRFYPIGIFKPTPKKSLPDYSVDERVSHLKK